MAGYNYYSGVDPAGGSQPQAPSSPYMGAVQNTMRQAQNPGQGAGPSAYQPGAYMGSGIGANAPTSSFGGGAVNSPYAGAINTAASSTAAPQIKAAAATTILPTTGGQGASTNPAASAPSSAATGTQNFVTAPYGLQGNNAFYLSAGAPSDLFNPYSSNTAVQNSAVAGGGHVMDADIGALAQQQQNLGNPYFASLKAMGVDPTLAPAIIAAGYNPFYQNSVAAYLQNQSQSAPVSGVTYGYKPGFGTVGTDGNLSFDVAQQPQGFQGGSLGDYFGNIGAYQNYNAQMAPYYGSNPGFNSTDYVGSQIGTNNTGFENVNTAGIPTVGQNNTRLIDANNPMGG